MNLITACYLDPSLTECQKSHEQIIEQTAGKKEDTGFILLKLKCCGFPVCVGGWGSGGRMRAIADNLRQLDARNLRVSPERLMEKLAGNGETVNGRELLFVSVRDEFCIGGTAGRVYALGGSFGRGYAQTLNLSGESRCGRIESGAGMLLLDCGESGKNISDFTDLVGDCFFIRGELTEEKMNARLRELISHCRHPAKRAILVMAI